MKENTATNTTTARLVAALLRDALNAGSYDSLADLIGEVKTRCGRMRIRWTPDDFTEALRLVGSNRELPMVGGLLVRQTPPPPEVEAVPWVPRDVAARIVKELWKRVGLPRVGFSRGRRHVR